MLPSDKYTGLTEETLRSVLLYDEDTGIFQWRNSKNQVGSGVAGWLNPLTGYLIITVFGHKYMAHRLAWLYFYGKWPEDRLDHINCNKSDNRICNLRHSTDSLNCANRPKWKNKSFPKGVSLHKGGRYIARIQLNGVSNYLGLFDTVDEAYHAYCDKAHETFGEFARV